MAHKSQKKVYETAFDSKVNKKSEDGSGYLFDKIANLPILQLLNPKRRSKNATPQSSSKLSFSKTVSNLHHPTTTDCFNGNVSSCFSQKVPHKTKFQAGGTPRFGRRGARSRGICPPARSLSSHHITSSSLRPIGLSKSDDQILNSVSDSPDNEDCLEGYIEGKQAEDLARDLITLHVSAERSPRHRPLKCPGSSSPYLPHRRHRRVAQRGMSVDARISGWCSTADAANGNTNSGRGVGDPQKNKKGKATSIMVLHHPHINSPRLHHQGSSALCSPQLHHVTGSYYNKSAQGSSSSVSSSPRMSFSSNSSPKVYHSSATPSPRLIHERNYSPKLVKSNLSSPKLFHNGNFTSSASSHPIKSRKAQNPIHRNLQSTSIGRVLQSSCESNSSDLSIPSSNSAILLEEEGVGHSKITHKIKLERSNTAQERDRSKCLAKMKPLELHSPPGTAPLPIKFIKKTPLTDKSPSSWFSPPRQKDLNLPVKRSFNQSKNIKSSQKTVIRDASKSRSGNDKSSHCLDGSKERSGVGGSALSEGSQSSLNCSMDVLLDNASQLGRVEPNVSGGKTSSFSLESMMSGGSSFESLKSSMSEGSRSVVLEVNGESTGSTWKTMGSNSSLPLRPSLLLPAPHRSLIQSAKFQILSPISDKSQEPSSTDTGGPIAGAPPSLINCGFVGGGSKRTSPQDILQQTPVQPKNIHEDFRNVHHMIPGPSSSRHNNRTGSDSGISIEYNATQQSSKSPSGHTAFKDLPFDMPKLRRRLAAARSCPSTSNSSLTSSGAEKTTSQNVSLNPTISRLQADNCCRSGTSSSNSSDWDVQSSATGSSNEGTPKRLALALDLGCKAMATTGQKVDVNIPLGKQAWYHGYINRSEAESVLRIESEGSYLVRSLDTPRKEYSLALKASCGFMHLKIQCVDEGFRVGRGSDVFPSVPHAVHHHSIHRLPIKGAEHMFLMKPVVSDTL